MSSSNPNLVADDGTQLFALRWSPGNRPTGTVVIVHGLGDHCQRFEHVAERFVSAGFDVIAFDQRGHGKTAGQRGHVDRYDRLLDDISCALDYASSLSGRHRFLFGQSFGGGLVLNHAARRCPDIQGVVAMSPLIRPATPPQWWKRFAARTLNVVWPRFAFATNLDDRAMTHDPDSLRQRRDDPLIHHHVSARLASQMLDAGNWVLENADKIRIPSLVMHGDEDSVTEHAASRELAQRMGEACSWKTWEGLYHELHWEHGRDSILNCVVDWMSAVDADATR